LIVPLSLAPLLTGAGDPPPRPAAVVAVPGDTQDLVYFHESRPYLIRLHLQEQGRPYQAAWSNYIDNLFTFLDWDGDGALNKEELEHAPNAQQLIQELLGGEALESGPAPPFADVDVDPKDGKVTRAELKRYYLRHGAGPLHVELGQRQGKRDSLTDALFKHLNTNQDGKLSKAELTAAAATLGKLDSNDDEMISLSELAPRFWEGGSFLFRHLPEPQALADAAPFLLLSPGESAEPLVQQLLKRYDRDKNGKLSRAEIGLGKTEFDRLDTNHDGELDARELANWARQPPDLELVLELGDNSRESWSIIASADARARPFPPVLTRTYDAAIIQLPDTRIELLRGGRERFAGAVRRQSYAQSFRAADRIGNGFLEARQIYQPPFDFVALLRLADRNGDGKLSMQELEDYLAMQAKSGDAFTVLTIADRGRSLFEFLDADRDGRLSLRELHTAWKRLAPWDRNGDGCISRDEVPRQFLLTLSRGHPIFSERAVSVPGYSPVPLTPRPARGPLWFRKMDRNGDGDVSSREFLGTAEQFKRIDTDGDGLISVEEAERADKKLRKRSK
jgi:Ca2+-binding EF-hand superfamily protein